ncbi:unnamed protein product [Lepeophtheirus salmonis]|uniref:(salmon louse) hypothetical protein n=1 Tax=Lepeophtheirus salmonis TaxID=72036 RepID=A0A7R8H706_LEPSM|nr:unnamed protein product [Lepeophtheirus salmonis]CAF2892885.1 unnamed protein product [Lepeophtheirus salmonis]
MERENNSFVEVKKSLEKVHIMLYERKKNNLLPLKVKETPAQKQKNGFGQRCAHFSAEVQSLYSAWLGYLERWMAPMEEFLFFHVDGSESPILRNSLREFNSYEEFIELQAHQRWTNFLEKSKSIAFYSELLKIVQFFVFFATPAQNANVERTFPLVRAQWTKERNRLSVESLKGILCTQYNFNNMTCKDFHTYIIGNR